MHHFREVGHHVGGHPFVCEPFHARHHCKHRDDDDDEMMTMMTMMMREMKTRKMETEDDQLKIRGQRRDGEDASY